MKEFIEKKERAEFENNVRIWEIEKREAALQLKEREIELKRRELEVRRAEKELGLQERVSETF